MRSHEVSPRKCWEFVFLASEESELSSRSIWEQIPASPCAQLQKITVSTFSMQLGQIRLQSPIASEATALDRSWRKLRLILRRGRPISIWGGGKTSYARTEKNYFNGLQIQLHHNWPEVHLGRQGSLLGSPMWPWGVSGQFLTLLGCNAMWQILICRSLAIPQFPRPFTVRLFSYGALWFSAVEPNRTVPYDFAS